METVPVLNDITTALGRITGYIHRTPVLTSAQINNITGCNLWFKCENFQKVGAFKFRGGINAVLRLSAEELSRGVITHSSGNFAAALALAASIAGAKAYIVMPENSPVAKRNAVAGYGAEITLCKPTLEAREETTNAIIRDKGSVFIHPYDNFDVICGQGTCGYELISDYPEIDTVVVPVGGGGLISGIVTAVKGINPAVRVIGAEPAGAGDAAESFRTGNYIPAHKPSTIADGLLTTLSPFTYRIIRKRVDDIITVSEESIIESMRLIWERMKIVVEPSGAVPLAVVLENRELFSDGITGLIVSGGNVDLGRLPF
ncbi:MAG: pyridoxal-phosphate dependent enzyme [Bacteroidales bacterium]|nr:pyridoxal-phosphate dependent enzyme [Bacteroidales bacterium]